jgi:hypothetical protein
MSWNQFENNIKDAFLERIKSSEESKGPDAELVKIATTITNEYHNIVISTKETIAGSRRGFTPIGIAALNGLKIGIQSAIFASLKTMQASNVKPNSAILSPIGAAVVAYWSGALVPGSINPIPMPVVPAYITPTPGSLIIFPGNPTPIIKGFKKAYSSNFDDSGNLSIEDVVAKMAKDLRDGFEAHANSVSGIYVGLIPAVIPIPMVTPWKGMKP